MSAETAVVALAVLLAAAVVVLALRAIYFDSARFRGLWERVDKLEADRSRDREELLRLRRLVDTLAGWVQLLRGQLLVNGIMPPPGIPDDVMSWLGGRQGHYTHIHELIEAHFSADEIRDLAFGLGLNSEMLGADKAGMGRELVEMCERRGLSGELRRVLGEKRPVVDW